MQAFASLRSSTSPLLHFSISPTLQPSTLPLSTPTTADPPRITHHAARTSNHASHTLQPKAAQNLDAVILALLALVMLFAPVSIAGTQISLGLAVLVWIVKMAWTRHWEVVRTPIEPPFWSFAAVAVVASVFSIHPYASFIRLKHLLLIVIVYLVVSKVHQRSHLHRLAYVLMASASAAAGWGLVRYFAGAGPKVMATQSTTMTFGAMSVMIATLTTSYVLFSRLRWWRILLVAGLALQAAALSLSYVRGAYLGFATGLFLLAALKQRRLIVYLVLAMVLLAFLLPRDILVRVASIADLSYPSTQVRLYQWKTALAIFRDHPVLGVGWIDLAELTRRYVRFGAGVPASVRHDVVSIGHFHNMYVTTLVCFGALGFVAFLWLMLRIAVKGYRTHRAIVGGDADTGALVAGGLAAFGGFLVSGLFDWTFGDAEVVTVMWIMVSFVFAALRAVRDEGPAGAAGGRGR